MDNLEQTFEQVTQLIADGKTEKAIDQLKQVLRDNPDGYGDTYDNLVLLSSQYSIWERNHLQGVQADNRELNRINVNLLNIIKDLRRAAHEPKPAPRPSARATPPPPPPVTPDPIQVATQPVPAQPHPRPVGGGFGSLKKYANWFFVGLGVLMLIAIIAAMFDGDIEDGPTTYDDTPEITGNQQNSSGNQFQPLLNQTNVQTTPQLLSANTSLADEAANELADAFGGTRWFNPQLSELTLDPDGIEGSYCNGYCTMLVTHFDTYGNYYGTWEDRSTGASLVGTFVFRLPLGSELMILAVYPNGTYTNFPFVKNELGF